MKLNNSIKMQHLLIHALAKCSVYSELIQI